MSDGTGSTACVYCGTRYHGIDNSLFSQTVDHIIPVSKLGNNKKINRIWCCRRCNLLKGGLTPEEFDVFLRLLITRMSNGSKVLEADRQTMLLIRRANSEIIKRIKPIRHHLIII